MKEGSFWRKLVLVGLLATSLAFAGCSADDGSDGAPGAPGVDGTDGTEGTPGTPGNPGTPGSDGATVLANAHAVDQRGATVTVLDVTPTATGADITAKIEVDGVARSDFGTVVMVASYIRTTDPTRVPGKIGSYDYGSGTGTVVNNGDGTYVISASAPQGTDPAKNWVTQGWWTSATETTWMVRLNTGAGINYPEANIVAHATADGQHLRKMVSNQACINCHSTNIFKEQHPSRVYHNSAYGSQSCVTCHTHSGRPSLMAYVHGIHNSDNMAERSITSGTVTVVKPEGVFARNNSTTNSPTTWYSVSYPTYMNNCSVCHDTDASLTAANDAAVSYALCMSCHDSWGGFHDSTFGGIDHTNFTATTTCTVCHDGSVAPAKAKEFHNGLLTERSGLIWDGKDVSVTEGARIVQTFDSVERSGDNLIVKWSATLDGAAVNPCNATISATAPTWQSSFSILRAYGQGDDWTNPGIGTTPGAPVSTNLNFTAETGNTVCDANVATTTVALTAAELATTATKGRVALQGKPKITFTPAAQDISVRAKTPTRDFVVATGALAAERRPIVDTENCLKCHVGSLYQHGGNRIDNVDLCVMCHNPASSEKNVRVGIGVDATEAYDGKNGQTFEFKTMLHSLHSAGETNVPLVYYRSFGIFAFAKDESVLKGWPGTGFQIVTGSSPSGTNPDGTSRNHNFHAPTYPQRLNNCVACHKEGTYGLPDQGKAVANTVDAGGTTYSDQVDDTLRGPAAAACMSCHQSAVASTQAGLQAHASLMGWAPTTFANGREDILGYQAVETCYFCHK